MTTPPKSVFLSHAFEDKAVAREIANRLRNGGANVWFDEWEIKAGDSLVQKVFSEGLKNCDVFIILLSKHSVSSQWVKHELDVAMISKISGLTKILPVLVERCEIPIPLRALMWVDVSEDIDAGVRKMLESIHDVDLKPPLGPKPAYVSTLNRQVQGLSKAATAIGLLFLEASGSITSDYQLGANGEWLSEQLEGLTPQMINDGVDELESLGLIKTRNYLGTAPFDFGEIYPTYLLYMYFKDEGLGYRPEEDIQVVASAVVAKESLRGNELVELTSLPIVRINRAIAYLEDNGIIDVMNFLGTAPYDFGIVRATRQTRQFVRG